ncbi:MAG: hypothetical protein WCP82_09325 [Alphaproteobacteria bacterium]
MPLLTKFGTQYGNRLQRTGRQFFVAPDTSTGGNQAYTGIAGNTVSSSNNNDGLSPERPVATVDYAVNTLATQVGDMVILLPGTHTVLNQVRPAAGVAIFGSEMAENTAWMGNIGGQGYQGPTVLTSTGTNIHLINIGTSNVEIGYLTLRPTTAYSAVIFATGNNNVQTGNSTLAGLNGISIHDVVIDLVTPAASVNTRGIDFGGRTTTGTGHLGRLIAGFNATVYAHLANITVHGQAATGEGIHLATCSVHIIHPIFRCTPNVNAAGVWASAFIVASTVNNSLVEEGIWISSATSVPGYGSCIDGGQANAYNLDGVTFANCLFPRAGQLTYTTPLTLSGVPSGNMGSPAHGFPTNTVSFANSFLAGTATMYIYAGGA